MGCTMQNIDRLCKAKPNPFNTPNSLRHYFHNHFDVTPVVSTILTLVIVVESPERFDGEWNMFAYATNIPVTKDNALELADSYRSRWGLETGYRVKEEVRGKTCSRNYAIRLFLQLLSILLYNLWQLCNVTFSIAMCWCKEGYVIILEEFKDIISDSILGR